MSAYRVRVELDGPVATPFHSGTLFGHLCWARWHEDGEEPLERWLDELEQRPFLISDAFPQGWLPRPVLRPARSAQAGGLREKQEEKELRRQGLIPVDVFLRIREALNDSVLIEALKKDGRKRSGMVEYRMAHNTINRRTGTTPEAGGLYFMDESWPQGENGRTWEVYIDAETGGGELEALFNLAGSLGYGRDAALGRGQFRARVEPAPEELLAGAGNRRMSLSHGTLTPNMSEARYKVQTHYGKVGGLLAVNQPPFKRPLALLKPGATFAAGSSGPFGAMLRGVHPQLEKVRHNGWHLTVPYTETEG